MKKPIKILVATPFYYPHWGGSERYVLELYSEVIKQNKNVKVDILTYDTEKTGVYKQVYKGMTIYRVPAWNILPGQFAIPNYSMIVKLFKQLKNNSYDIFNSQTRFFENSWWVPFAARYLGAKSVLTDHCASHPVHKSTLVSVVAKMVDYIFVKCIMNKYDSVIATSEATSKFLISQGAEGVDVVSNGIDTSEYKKRTKNNKKIQITFAGRMIESKGVSLAVEAALKLVDRYSNLVFTFAGDGLLFSKLSKYERKDKIVFVGSLNKKNLQQLLSRTNIFLFPSTHHDGLPSVLLEAGMSECSVISTKSGGSADIILNNKTGLIIEPKLEDLEKAITKLVENNELSKEFGRNLFTLVNQSYDWKNIADEYMQILVSLLSK